MEKLISEMTLGVEWDVKLHRLTYRTHLMHNFVWILSTFNYGSSSPVR